MPGAGRVLVVEDRAVGRRELCQALQREGFTVYAAEDADKALGYLNENIDVLLCDLSNGATLNMDLLALWKKQCPRTKFVIASSHASIPAAVAAIKAGAYDYVVEPQSHEKLALLVRHAVQTLREQDQVLRLADSVGLNNLVGKSMQMQQVIARVHRAASVDSTVLILGENGTGKDRVARALHDNSPRRNGPFVAVNVAAVPSTLVESELFGHVRGAFTGATDRRTGRFEQADGGTLFIDEIGDFDAALQPKLLRVLETLTITPVGGQEDKRVNVRVIAATSRDIEKMIPEGKFREDLYYRLNVVRITIPPLRERPEDIPMLAEDLMAQIIEQKRPIGRRLCSDVMNRLLAYHWPGNVRELRNTLESMMVLADHEVLTDADLPDHILHGAADPVIRRDTEVLTMQEMEKLAIVRALDDCRGNRTHAAHRLAISVRTLQRKLHEYSIASLPHPDDSDTLSQP